MKVLCFAVFLLWSAVHLECGVPLCSELDQIIKQMKETSARMWTDKFDKDHQYESFYSFLFRCSKQKPVHFFEIGLGCLHPFTASEPKVWKLLLPHSTRSYLDYDKGCLTRNPGSELAINGQVIFGDQSDKAALHNVTSSLPEGVDVVIDDGSHTPRFMITSMEYLFPGLVRPGGYYVMEDLYGNFWSAFNRLMDVSVMQYIGELMSALSSGGSLPSPMADCSEIVCQFSVCWFKKALVPSATTATAELGMDWQSSNRSRLPLSSSSSLRKSDVWCDGSQALEPGVSTLLRSQLACEDLENMVVYHLVTATTSSARNNKNDSDSHLYMQVFECSTVIPYPIEGGAVDPRGGGEGRRPFVIVDDVVSKETVSESEAEAVSLDVRRRAMVRLFREVLAPGGYYFWRNDGNSSRNADPFIVALYSMYCRLTREIRVSQPHSRSKGKSFSKRSRIVGLVLPGGLCHESTFSWCQYVHRVGCDRYWCYVQSRGNHQPTFWHLGQFFELGPLISDISFLEKVLQRSPFTNP